MNIQLTGMYNTSHGPSNKYVRNFTFYLDPPLFFFACNTQSKCKGDLTPLPLGAYVVNGRSPFNFNSRSQVKWCWKHLCFPLFANLRKIC